MKNDLQKNMSFLIKNTSIVFVIKILGMGLGFIFQIILGKLLGASYYGQYTVFITFLNIFSLFTLIGIDTCLIRSIPRIDKKDKLRFSILKSSLFFVLILSVFIIGLLYIFKHQALTLFKIDQKYYNILLFTLLITSLSKVIDGFLQGEGKTVVSTVFATVASNSLKIILFFTVFFITKKNFESALMSYSISEVFLVLGRYLYVKFQQKKTGFDADSKYSNEEYRMFLKYSLLLFVISGIGIVIHNIDKVLVNYYVGPGPVGIYKVAENYVGLVSVFTAPFVVFWPMISKLYHNKQMDMLNQIFKYVVKFISIISIPVIIFMIVFSKPLLMIFGRDFQNGYSILYLLLIGYVYDALCGPVGAFMNMTDYAIYNFWDNVLLLVLDVAGCLILIPKLGAAGAAIATSLSEVIINTVNIIQNKKFMNIFPYDRDNIYFFLFSIVLFLIDKGLYGIIHINIYLKAILFLIFNYAIFIAMFTVVSRPDYKKIFNELVSVKHESSEGL